MAEWIPWSEGDPIPDPGKYFVTAPGLGVGRYDVYRDLLGDYDLRAWRYDGVIAYRPWVEREPNPEPYSPLQPLVDEEGD